MTQIAEHGVGRHTEFDPTLVEAIDGHRREIDAGDVMAHRGKAQSKATVTRGRVFERALAEATERGEVTPELGVAFRDPAVAAARIYEVIVVALIVVLMVVKPF